MTSKSKNSKKTELSLWGWGFDIESGELTEDQAKKIAENGISQEQFYNLVGSGPSESGPTNISLSANGKYVAEFDINEALKESEKPLELGEKDTYYLVHTDWQKGEWGKLVISGAFDRSKLTVNFGSYELNGYEFAYLDFSYDGAEFEFGSTSQKSLDCFFLTPTGDRSEIEFTDD